MLRVGTVGMLAGIRIADFVFAPVRDVRLQAFAGSAWRGAFGHALKRLVCALRMRPCEGCPLAGVCLFPRFFGGDAEHDAPRPYILAPEPSPPGGWVRAGQAFGVRLTLLPAAEAAAPYAVHALLEAAGSGLTRDRVAFLCRSVAAPPGAPAASDAAAPGGGIPATDLRPPPAPRIARLRFATPLRLRLRGDLVTGADLTAAHLVAAVQRRVRGLGLPLPEPVFAAAAEQARALAWRHARLGWLETTRMSSRQNARMQLGGIVGEASIELGGGADLWSVLWLGSVLHLGKGASMGFGRIEVHGG